ncbi:hypothetical protein BGZ47_002998, partial [Haplosporangium gracile]
MVKYLYVNIAASKPSSVLFDSSHTSVHGIFRLNNSFVLDDDSYCSTKSDTASSANCRCRIPDLP